MSIVLTKDHMASLLSLPIDGVTPLFLSSGLLLIRGKYVGYWTSEEGVVLGPEYATIQRFGDILKVGKVTVDRSANMAVYGGFSISKHQWVIPIKHSLYAFWDYYDKYQSLEPR